LIELNSETDFVAKSEEFVALADKIVEVVKTSKANDVETVKAAELDGGTVESAIQAQSAKTGEKLELRRLAFFEGKTETYLHRCGAGLPRAVGVLVEYTGDDAEAARGAAMQVAALKARYLTREDVPAEIVEKEKAIAEK